MPMFKKNEQAPADDAAVSQHIRQAMEADRAKPVDEQAAATSKEANGYADDVPTEHQTIDNPSELLKQVLELKEIIESQNARIAGLESGAAPATPAGLSTPTFDRAGQTVGVFEKYAIDPARYPDPRARLATESRLAKFAFDLNYFLLWGVSQNRYQTVDKQWIVEPRFTLTLGRWREDPNTGEEVRDGNGDRVGFVICRLVFHEDPDAAIIVARDNGINIDQFNQIDFLNEMRYLRMRDWLLELFYPPRKAAAASKKQEVIGNKLVDVIAVSSVDAAAIPFSQEMKKG